MKKKSGKQKRQTYHNANSDWCPARVMHVTQSAVAFSKEHPGTIVILTFGEQGQLPQHSFNISPRTNAKRIVKQVTTY